MVKGNIPNRGHSLSQDIRANILQSSSIEPHLRQLHKPPRCQENDIANLRTITQRNLAPDFCGMEGLDAFLKGSDTTIPKKPFQSTYLSTY